MHEQHHHHTTMYIIILMSTISDRLASRVLHRDTDQEEVRLAAVLMI